jgi:hypothetical protein
MTWKGVARRKLVEFKYTLARGYQWCQLPTLAVIGAGIIKPYIPGLRFYQLSLLAFGIFLSVGWLDKRLGLLNQELSYATERNTKLLKLFEEKLK